MKVAFPLLICILMPTIGWTDGALDTTFGTAGRTLVAFNAGASNVDLAFGSVLQPDGKLVVVGNAANANGDQDFAIARLLATGQLDPSFGTAGKVMHGFDYGGGNSDTAYAVALAADGTIVVMGNVEYPGATPYATELLALHPDGTVAVTAAPIVGSSGVDMKVAADGSILVVGANTGAIEIDRFSSDLVLQSSQQVSVSSVAGTLNYPSSLVLRPNGKLTIAGTVQIPADPNPEYDCFILQLNANLSLDTGFGTNQTGVFSFSGGCSSHALQGDGKILLIEQAGAVNPALLFRVLADGSAFDSTFGSTTPRAGYSFWCYEQCPHADENENYAWSVAEQSDGKIVVAGYGSVADPARAPYDFGIARFAADGNPDDTFVGDYANASVGSVLIGFEDYTGSAFGQDDEAYSMAIDSLDRIYAIGTQYNAGDYNMAIVRLASDKIFFNGFEAKP